MRRAISLCTRHIHIVLAKIDACLKQRNQFHQALLHRSHAPAQCTTHLACSSPGLRQRLRINQVAHCLGLRQINLLGQKRSLRKLTRLCQPRAQLQRAPQQQLQHHRRAMRGNLHKLLTGVRVRRGKVRHHRFINATCLRALAIQHIRQPRPRMLQWLPQLYKLRANLRGLRPAQPHNSNPSTPRRSRNRCNRIYGYRLLGHFIHAAFYCRESASVLRAHFKRICTLPVALV